MVVVVTCGDCCGSFGNRFGEEAGEATEHVFATAGHSVNTAWNVSKIRKAINPASSANAAGALRNSAKNRNVIY